MTMSPALDPAVLESLRELTPPGEPDVLKEVLQLFLEDVPGRIERPLAISRPPRRWSRRSIQSSRACSSRSRA